MTALEKQSDIINRKLDDLQKQVTEMDKRLSERLTDLTTRVLLIQWIGGAFGLALITDLLNRLLRGGQGPTAVVQPMQPQGYASAAVPDAALVAAVTVAVLTALKAQQEKEHQTATIISPA